MTKPEDTTHDAGAPFERGVGPLVARLRQHQTWTVADANECIPAAVAEIEHLAAEVTKWQVEYAHADIDWQDASTECDRLRAALVEAMQQATEYDGLDVTKIGPQHWYTKAAEALRPNDADERKPPAART